MKNLYLLLDIGSLIGPLLLSFDKRVAFYKNWKHLFPAIIAMAAVFITWDILFTNHNVWRFNDAYLTGYYFFSLPIEECLFFFVVPYACIFIYECVKAYFSDFLKPIANPVFLVLALLLIIIGVVNYDKLYTTITFIATGLALLWVLYRKVTYLGHFLVAYLIVFIPFFLVNGVLTGSWIEGEVVSYNPSQILNIRALTIPIEDSVYNLLMLLMTLYFYESLKSKSVKLK